ncbi:hypothetical protein AB0G74_19365 [Streptomyces sp. NPDC020875]|uniref:hypothetical protein n=1 Tax=Streptomyces sp. NPDC020875 TaxID=3154898 RepID=UPI0033CEDF7B
MNGDGGVGPGGKDLRAQGLDLIAKGLTDALAELKELGMVGTAGTGRGFGDIALSGLELGHEDVADKFSTFCERWEWGVRTLINEGNTFAQGVGLSAGTYYETEKYVEGFLKIGANSLVGNPYATEDEVQREGWGDIAKSAVETDYSRESWEKAQANVEQGYKDAGRDLMTSRFLMHGLTPQNLHDDFGVSDADYDRWLDDTFGPSPEARAEAAQQAQQAQGAPGGGEG